MKKILSIVFATVIMLSAVPFSCIINSDVSFISISAFAAELNGLNKTDGKWYYYKNGKIDKTFVGMAKNQYGWWYVKNGTIDFSYTGMAKNQYGWWYIKKGKLDTTYTGMAKNQYGWWYMKNGKLDTTYTGMAKNQYGWWYMKKGKLDTTYTGIEKNQYGYWYMKNGKLDTSYNGTYTDYNGISWLIVNGKATKSSQKTITAKTKNVEIVDGDYVDITLSVYAPDDFDTIGFDYKYNNSVVSCEWGDWGDWNGDYTSISLRIYGLNPGKETIILYFDGQKSDIKESVNVTVIEKQPDYTFQLPECPLEVSRFGYKNSLYSTAKITNLKVNVTSSSSLVGVKLTVTGTKIYDKDPSVSSSCLIGYKIYNESGVVVKSGTISSPDVKLGETFVMTESIFCTNLEPGNYRIEILDVV